MKPAIVLLVAMSTLSLAPALAGERKPTGGETAQGTTVKSGKGNSSDRAAGAGGTAGDRPDATPGSGGERGTTAKGSKSNGSA